MDFFFTYTRHLVEATHLGDKPILGLNKAPPLFSLPIIVPVLYVVQYSILL